MCGDSHALLICIPVGPRTNSFVTNNHLIARVVGL